MYMFTRDSHIASIVVADGVIVFAGTNRARDRPRLRSIEVLVFICGQQLCMGEYICEGNNCNREYALLVHYILVCGSIILIIFTKR